MMTTIRSCTKRFQGSAIRDERGLSTVEYTIILLLIAVFAIGAWTAFGDALRAKVDESSADIAGIDNPGSSTPE